MKSLWRWKSERRVGEWTVTYVKQRNGCRMSCDVGTWRKGWRMSYDVGEVTERLENELCCISLSMSSAHSPTFPSLHLRHNSFSNLPVALPTSQLVLQPFHCFTYVTVHSPTLVSLLLRHNSFSNPSVALPTSQLILQPFHWFYYVTAHSPTLPLLHLRHSSLSNPSFASPASQALHLFHLASRPLYIRDIGKFVILLMIYYEITER